MASSKKPRATAISAEVIHDPFESGMLFDERLLTRAQALEKFFTPHPEAVNKRPSKENLYKSANNTFAELNPRSSFVAPQIRELYDPARIQRMGASMRGVDGQLQNGGVAFIDDDHIEQYLADMNDYFESDIQLTDLARHPKFGCYIITAFGHNRQLAVASANIESSGNPDSGIQFYVKVFQNPEFWRILANQATENTGEAPPMWVRARSIVKFQQFRNRDGQLTTKSEVGRLFNVDPDQIWRAERYDALPSAIKELVMAEKLPYSGAFELDQLVGIYDEPYIVELAIRLANNRSSGPQILDAVKRRKTASILTPEIRHIIDKDQITLPQAQELAKLVGVISDEALNEIAGWICTVKPDIALIRSTVKKMIEDRMAGVVSLYDEDSGIFSDPEVALKLASEMRQNEVRGAVQRTISDIATHFAGLQALITSGLMGNAAEFNPIAKGAPDHLYDLVGSLLESINTIDLEPSADSIIKDLKAFILGKDVPGNPMVDQIYDVLSKLKELLQLEKGETSESQLERRRLLGEQIIAIAKPTTPVQEGLF